MSLQPIQYSVLDKPLASAGVCAVMLMRVTHFRAADLSDTITAIATAPGAAGVGIVRVSGPQALSIADQLFRGRTRPSTVAGGRFLYGQFVAELDVIDEGLCLIFRGPHSYTGDDVVEFQSHGSPAALQAILAATVAAGARLARPGEYTLRAYLAGRLDLSQAEAVLNLVQATTDTARKQATLGLSGALSQRIAAVSADITRTLAALTAMLDYPEEGVPEEERTQPLLRAISELEALLATAQAGKLTQQGARLALIGKPNAGKSSLLNALLGYERSIVTPIAGTTRDYLEAQLELAGLPITLVDTAGLRDTDDLIEAQGVVQARKLAQAADLVLYLADGTLPLEAPELPQGVATISVQTKADLPLQWQSDKYIQVSANTGEGLAALRAAIEQALLGQHTRSEIWLGSERQVQAVRRAHAHLEAALALPDELASYELEQALHVLAELTGRDVHEDVIDAVFSNFCVGK